MCIPKLKSNERHAHMKILKSYTQGRETKCKTTRGVAEYGLRNQKIRKVYKKNKNVYNVFHSRSKWWWWKYTLPHTHFQSHIHFKLLYLYNIREHHLDLWIWVWIRLIYSFMSGSVRVHYRLLRKAFVKYYIIEIDNTVYSMQRWNKILIPWLHETVDYYI